MKTFFTAIAIIFSAIVMTATIFWELCVNEPAKYPSIDSLIRKGCGVSVVLMLVAISLNGWWC